MKRYTFKSPTYASTILATGKILNRTAKMLNMGFPYRESNPSLLGESQVS